MPSRLSVEEAAGYTGLSVSTLNKLRISGGGPEYLKICRRVFYRTADLDRWLESKRYRSTSEYGE
ncbi:MAG: helix-turn-helix domain-containing protein [Pseudomonadota bacterium]